MNTALRLYTDGAFRFERRNPGYGWVAVDSDETPVGSGAGQVANDGTASFAGEAMAAIAALEYAVSVGASVVHLCTDLESLAAHLRPDSKRKTTPSSARLREFVRKHPTLQIHVKRVSSSDPFHNAAHHLARAAIERIAA